ncbi:MAG: MFS transporter [Hyphomonadaceae bacterium]|nr:MFS transporter [Hyphomonadaceae bacterium]
MAIKDILSSRAARVTAVMSALFGTTGVIMVFLPRWLEVERGLTDSQIGVVLSLAQLARIFTGPAIAFWADGAADRTTPLKMVSIAAVTAYAVFFFAAQGFWPLLACGFLALSMTQAMTPLIEAATLRATAQGKMPYGVARGIGSIAFIFANVAGGAVVAQFGLNAVVVWVVSGLSLTVATAWLGLPREPGFKQTRAARAGAFGELLRNRRFLILIFACGLIQSGHAFYYGFSTITWRAQGLAPETVGLLWGFGVSVEVAFLWSLPFFERRLSPETLILLGAGGGVLRWLVMGFAPPLWALWPLQGMHAMSFAAAHVGAMRLIYREAPEHSQAMAQTLYAALSGGILIGAATMLSGALSDQVGARGYWAMAVIAAAGGTLALLLLRPPVRVPKAADH